MPIRQSGLHHLDRLDLELHDVATRGGQLEDVTTQVMPHRPPIDTHHLAGPEAGRVRPNRWSSSDRAIYGRSSRDETILRRSSSEGRQGLSVVETR